MRIPVSTQDPVRVQPTEQRIWRDKAFYYLFAPAPGASTYSVTVPMGLSWRIKQVYIEYAATADAGNRDVKVSRQRANFPDPVHRTYWAWDSTSHITANQTRTINLFPGAAHYVGGSTSYHTEAYSWLDLPMVHDEAILFSVTGPFAGDSMPIRIVYEEASL